ncbi:hypothetical protein ID852_08470 [Xenorhabdus sp. 42]|uniref:hypothetical protein n=1 Tax=Xenorhabdus szentirmaii TaxID=290112 RepID=UPI0019925E47|nr:MULTISPECIES: hypothetical protein [unclassified Xenorhabdus]MBD2780853.1 hypothetical protein [Xenorhabdus sp. 38]MBD2820725.1 hypothetical protein [Xenorhabdus sp. 42]
MLTINEIFGRINQNGNIDILYAETGEAITHIEFVNNIYPVDSNFCTHYEHRKRVKNHAIKLMAILDWTL